MTAAASNPMAAETSPLYRSDGPLLYAELCRGRRVNGTRRPSDGPLKCSNATRRAVRGRFCARRRRTDGPKTLRS